MPDRDIQNKLKAVKLLMLDVDGVLTDGGLYIDDNGVESKRFDVRDGFGIRLLIQSGVRVAVVTGRKSIALEHRCRELGISPVYQAVRDKAALLGEIVEQAAVTAEQCAFVADDLPDLAIIKRVGLSIAVADAHALIRSTADLTTQNRGGHGAVREICERILAARDCWDDVLKAYG